MTRKPRILYMAGPGDVIGTYKHWREGDDDPTQVSIAYSHQFYELCRESGYAGTVISYCPRAERLQDGDFEIEHRPVPFQKRSGLLFHFGWYLFSLSVAWSAIRRRADVAVLMAGTHLAPYWLMRIAGVRVVMTQHCVLWPKKLGPRGAWKMIHAIDRPFFRRGCDAILAISADIVEQIDRLTGGSHPDASLFRPTYREASFSGIASAQHQAEPFRVLFVGRVEEDKGALELVDIAKAAQQAAGREIIIDVAGDGGALEELRRRVDDQGLGQHVVTHGYCTRERMRELYAGCHVVLAPTQDNMIEGFNKVVVEAILSSRPVVTSSVCPALEVVREAAVEADSNDAGGYFRAIERLASDAGYYHEKVAACGELQQPFYDQHSGWASALQKQLAPLAPRADPAAVATSAEPRGGQLGCN